MKRDQRGFVVPLFAVVLVLLLVMVAFAVDLGATAERRRGSQNRSDAAALAAVQELGTLSAKYITDPDERDDAIEIATSIALDYVARNGGISPTDAGWDNCSDANHLEIVSSETPCISFSQDLTQARVRIPDESVDLHFASIVGIPDPQVRSSAIAELVTNITSSTRPILLRVGVSGMNCIEAGGNDGPAECDGVRLGPGDFGSMSSPRYKFLLGEGDDVNFALGVDHALRMTATNGTNYCDSSNSGDAHRCSSQAGGGLLNNTNATHDNANYVIASPGGSLDALTDGLLGSSNGLFSTSGGDVKALLYRPDGAEASSLNPPGGPTAPTEIFGDTFTGFNGTHISEYLLDPNSIGCSSLPTPAVNATDLAYSDCNNDLSAYIVSNPASNEPIFSSDIVQSPRFGVAPVTDSELSGASTVARIVDFYGIYLHGLYGNANQVKQLSAFVFPLRMVQPASGSGPGLPYVGGPFSVRLIR